MMPEYGTSIFWIATVVAGLLIRWIGWRICWPPGFIGRHVMAFFFATLGCAGMIVVLNYEHSVARLMHDLPDGLGATALIYGILTAAIIERAFWLLECFRTNRIEGGPS